MTTEPKKSTSWKEDATDETHESYGIINFTRVHGGTGAFALFGSHLNRHHTTIRLRIQRAKRTVDHGLGYERYSPASREEMIEVELSPAQYAELLTTMNMGEGVPCTLRYVNGKKMADPPTTHIEAENVRADFQKKMDTWVGTLRQTQKRVEEILEGSGTVKKDERKELLSIIPRIISKVVSDMPFFVGQFQEATERVRTAAKAEIDAFTMSVITRAGLKAIAEHPAEAQKLLAEKPPEE